LEKQKFRSFSKFSSFSSNARIPSSNTSISTRPRQHNPPTINALQYPNVLPHVTSAMPFVQRFRSVIVIPPYVHHPTSCCCGFSAVGNQPSLMQLDSLLASNIPYIPPLLGIFTSASVCSSIGQSSSRVILHLRHYAIMFFGFAYAVCLSHSPTSTSTSLLVCGHPVALSDRHRLSAISTYVSASPHAFAFALLHRPRTRPCVHVSTQRFRRSSTPRGGVLS
jgi:hypothetical protein